METNTILLILAAIIIGYYFMNTSKPYDGILYNHQDVKSYCDAICINKNQVFNGVFDRKSMFSNTICGCEHIKDTPRNENTVQNINNGGSFIPSIADIELYTNIDDKTTILPQVVPSDTIFNDRNVLEQHTKNRLNSLIFG